jgi:predicted nucleic acid-binding protein
MTRAVPDTNIWVSSILWRGNPYRIRKLGEKREVVLITSLAILAEITRVLREYFDLSDEEAYEWHQRIGENTEIVRPTRLRELYKQYQEGEISLGYLAEQLGVGTWRAYHLLEERGLRTANM